MAVGVAARLVGVFPEVLAVLEQEEALVLLLALAVLEEALQRPLSAAREQVLAGLSFLKTVQISPLKVR